MGEIAVFVPGNCERHKNHLVRLGLGALLDDRVTVATIDGPGPDGKHGVTFHFAHDNEPEYRGGKIIPTSQWVPLEKDGELEAGRAYLGWNLDAPPGPLDLLRAKWKHGEPLKLGDGGEWLIPIAKQLPCTLSLGSDGSVATRPVEQYRKFFADAREALTWFEADEDGKARVSHREGYRFAVDALAINYRMTPDLASALGLISTEHLWGVPKIVCEWDAMAALAAQLAAPGQKKTDSICDTQPIVAGAPD